MVYTYLDADHGDKLLNFHDRASQSRPSLRDIDLKNDSISCAHLAELKVRLVAARQERYDMLGKCDERLLIGWTAAHRTTGPVAVKEGNQIQHIIVKANHRIATGIHDVILSHHNLQTCRDKELERRRKNGSG